jgi:murein DD-endopeptidase MepM/ murein hydrolase activator NlpD
MSTTSRRSPHHTTIRAFTAGAGCGFLAGAFVAAVIVWQFGNVIGTRTAALRHSSPTAAAMNRWSDGVDDAGAAVLEGEERPAATTGHDSAPAAPAPDAAIGPPAESPKELAGRDLDVPVQGVRPDQLVRSFSDARGERRHEALDILAPEGTPVLAVEEGTIARLFLSKAGGITIYQFDSGARYCYYYAHLQRYADGLREGQRVRKGEVIGYVGTTGNAPKNTPHLHFAVFRLTADKHWWEGTPIDPYDVLR